MEAPVAFHDLVQHCRTGGEYTIFGNGGERLEAFGLIQRGDRLPHQAVCDVVKAAVEGESFDMRIVNPRKDVV